MENNVVIEYKPKHIEVENNTKTENEELKVCDDAKELMVPENNTNKMKATEKIAREPKAKKKKSQEKNTIIWRKLSRFL